MHAGALTLSETPQGERPDLKELLAVDPGLLKVMAVQETRPSVDQPFVVTDLTGKPELLYVGENDLGVAGKATATVAFSTDNGAHFTRSIVDPRPVAIQNGPSVRVGFGGNHVAYVAYFGCRTQ